MVQSSMLTHGYMAEDFNLKALYMNMSGVTQSGSPYDGIYLYANSTGYWISGNSCNKIPGTSPDWNQRCLPSGNSTTEQTTIAGVAATVYERVETFDNGQFANGTLYMFTTGTNIPISAMTYAPQNGPVPATLMAFTFYEPSLSVDTSVFDIPAICDNARPMKIEDIEHHQALKRGARLL